VPAAASGRWPNLLQIVVQQLGNSLPLTLLGFYQLDRYGLKLNSAGSRRAWYAGHPLFQGFVQILSDIFCLPAGSDVAKK